MDTGTFDCPFLFSIALSSSWQLKELTGPSWDLSPGPSWHSAQLRTMFHLPVPLLSALAGPVPTCGCPAAHPAGRRKLLYPSLSMRQTCSVFWQKADGGGDVYQDPSHFCWLFATGVTLSCCVAPYRSALPDGRAGLHQWLRDFPGHGPDPPQPGAVSPA